MAAGPEPGARKQELRYQLEIFALCGFAIAQPLLDVFGRNLEAFVFRGADRLEVVLFALGVTFLPWLVLGAAAAMTGIAGPTVRRWVQVVVLAVLAGLIGVHVVKQTTGLEGAALAFVSVAIGVGFGAAYRRVRTVGLWARYASLAPLVFLAMFVFVAPASNLVFPDDARVAQVQGSKLPRHIVFVLFDELPTSSLIGADGRIDAERFPSFARLADDSSWYRSSTSVSGSTQFAVPALLSGTYPRDVLATAANYPNTLFTLLGGEYEVHASEVITALCPTSVCDSRSRGAAALRKLSRDAVDVWRQQVSLHESDRQIAAGFVEETRSATTAAGSEEPIDGFAAMAQDETTAPARLREFIDAIDPETPSLDFIHLLLPHQPWHFYPGGAQYPFPDPDPGLEVFISGRWGPTPRPAELGRQRHLLQAQYVDAQLGQVVARLRDQGIYDESLIVVTADHGIAFEPGQQLRAGGESDAFPTDIFDQVMWAPLVIKAPHQRAGRVSDANVQSVDVVPTIADLLGIRVPWRSDGIPASQRRRTNQKDYFTSKTVDFTRTTLGRRTRADGAAGLRRMLARNQRAFAPTSDPRWAFYRVGPYAEVIGRRIDEVATGPGAALEVTVEDPGAYRSVDLAGGSVPGLLRGFIPAESDPAIAVSVKGTIAGVSRPFTSTDGPRRFAVLIPEFLFTTGSNDVRLHVVEGTGADAVLRPLEVDGLG